MGTATAAELLYTTRTLTAAKALELGLVNRVVAHDGLLDAAYGVAAEIAANAPAGGASGQRMVRHVTTESLEDHVQRQFLALLPLFRTEDFVEGMLSFMEKRPARFQGR